MDKLIEAVVKIVPASVVIGAVAVLISAVSIFHWREYRTYSDVVRDRLFLSGLVAIIAVLFVYEINRKETTGESRSALLVVPLFRHDEGDQFRTAIGTQIEASLSTLFSSSGSSIKYIESFIADEESARETAKRHGAVAIIHGPTVIRSGEQAWSSFRLTMLEPRLTKTYPLVPLQAPREVLEDIVATISSANSASPGLNNEPNPVLARLNALEQGLNEVQITLAVANSLGSASVAPSYSSKRALVVGAGDVHGITWDRLPGAERDAQKFAQVLTALGFEVTLITGDQATSTQVMERLGRFRNQVAKDELFLFYFAGHSVVPGNGRKRVLHLLFNDTDPNAIERQLGVLELQRELEKIPALHKVAILDASNGTIGLSAAPLQSGGAGSPVVQFFTGTQDNEYGSESPGGGVFTNALTATLMNIGPSGAWLDEIVRQTSARMDQQRPKLLTVSGSGRVYIVP